MAQSLQTQAIFKKILHFVSFHTFKSATIRRVQSLYLLYDKTHNIIKSGILFDAKSRCCPKK